MLRISEKGGVFLKRGLHSGKGGSILERKVSILNETKIASRLQREHRLAVERKYLMKSDCCTIALGKLTRLSLEPEGKPITNR